MHCENSSKIVILTDEEEKDPKMEFDALGDILTAIARYSPPRFTIGIYGEWGTGKSTLMKLFYEMLKAIFLSNIFVLKKAYHKIYGIDK